MSSSSLVVVDPTRPRSRIYIYLYISKPILTRFHYFEQILLRALDVIDESLWCIVWASVCPNGPDGDKTVQLFAGVYDNLWSRIFISDYVVELEIRVGLNRVSSCRGMRLYDVIGWSNYAQASTPHT